MAQRKRIRPKVVKKPEQCKCVACGLDIVEALEASHLISQQLLNYLPEPDRKFYDYDGFNVILLCGTCHTLYDKGLLPYDKAQRVIPHLRLSLVELAIHLDTLLDAETFNKLDNFLELHNYERRKKETKTQ